MRVNVVQSTDRALIVVTMAEYEARLLLAGITNVSVNGGGDPVVAAADLATIKLLVLLESGIEQIEQVIMTDYPCEN